MTHDELLEKIQQRHWQLFNFHSVDQSNEASEFRKAVQENTNTLRAVVELHRCVEQTTGISYTSKNGLEVLETEKLCGYCSKVGWGKVYYPCKTTQTVEFHLQ